MCVHYLPTAPITRIMLRRALAVEGSAPNLKVKYFEKKGEIPVVIKNFALEARRMTIKYLFLINIRVDFRKPTKPFFLISSNSFDSMVISPFLVAFSRILAAPGISLGKNIRMNPFKMRIQLNVRKGSHQRPTQSGWLSSIPSGTWRYA